MTGYDRTGREAGQSHQDCGGKSELPAQTTENPFSNRNRGLTLLIKAYTLLSLNHDISDLLWESKN